MGVRDKPSKTPAEHRIKPSWKRALAQRLLPWFAAHQRDLPWRRAPDGYRTWISEIMLQQTQVVTVIPYFQRFIAAFPHVRALAEASEHDVLRHWEGLGYYRRARQMHRAARQIVEQHAGVFPQSLDDVLALPGIGRYTAGAIVSIAFDQRAPILEANTVRLLSRLIGLTGDPASSAGQKRLWEVADAILPPAGFRQFNQALMELGSLVCTPRNPACDRCPMASLCVAQLQGKQAEIPRSRPRPRIERVREAAVIVWRQDQVLLRRREAGERWAGLWDFLRFPLSEQTHVEDELLASIRSHCGLDVASPHPVTTITHGVTRFQITLDCFSARVRGRRRQLAQGEWQWAPLAALQDIPLSVTGRKLARLCQQGVPTARETSAAGK